MNSRMPQLVFDTNILVDALLARGHYYQYAVSLLNDVDSGKVEGWYAPHCITTVYYLVGKTLAIGSENRADSEKRTRDLVKELATILKPLPQTGDEILRIKDYTPGADFEDELIVQLAKEYLPNPLLVTRDRWFLYHGEIKAAHPKEIVEAEYKPWIDRDAGTAFIDLSRQQRALRPQLESRIHTVLQHGRYILGPEVSELEKRLVEYLGAKHCISCSSGTDALLMALMALDVGPGDAVFTTPFTFVATADVIARLGATPVFVDIDPRTYNLDPAKLDQAIRSLTSDLRPLTPKAVIPVDLYGLPCDYDAINAIADQYGLSVIQDSAQSFGAVYQGSLCPTQGDIGCTSFFPSKPLGGYGDGGALFTDDESLAERLRSIRVHGQGANKYDTVRLGLKGRMDTLQAAIVLPKLDIYPRELELRRQAAQYYNELLGPCSSALVPPLVPEGQKSAWALYTLLASNGEEREKLQSALKQEGIPTVVYYGRPLHLQPVFEPLGYRQGDFPVAEDCASRCFSLPMHPYLEQEEMERVAEVIRNNL